MPNISIKKITALLCALVFVMSLALSGCQIGGDEEETTTTTTTTNGYIAPEGESIVCPKCGSANTDSVLAEGETYDEHYICYDCKYEWYVLNGEAFEVKAEGEDVKITNYQPSYRPVYNNGGSGSGSSNNKKTTTTTTKKTTTTTTTNVWEYIQSGKWLNFLYIDENGNITTESDEGVAGFGYSTSEKCFYATGNAWQRNFGYNEVYDKTSQLIAISYDTINVYFDYDGGSDPRYSEWMIQLWKGQYGMVLLGAEVGVYYRTATGHTSNSTHYNAVSNADRPTIGLSLYHDGKHLFTRKQAKSWWQTGFVPGQLGVSSGVMVGSMYTNNLKAVTSITFKDEAMTNAFIGGLEKVSRIYNNVDAMNANDVNKGFRSYSFNPGDGNTPGTYKVEGNKVTLAWQ